VGGGYGPLRLSVNACYSQAHVHVHWRRVFNTSKGCTAKVAMTPAEKPATASTKEGESPLLCVLVSMGGYTLVMIKKGNSTEGLHAGPGTTRPTAAIWGMWV